MPTINEKQNATAENRYTQITLKYFNICIYKYHIYK